MLKEVTNLFHLFFFSYKTVKFSTKQVCKVKKKKFSRMFNAKHTLTSSRFIGFFSIHVA